MNGRRGCCGRRFEGLQYHKHFWLLGGGGVQDVGEFIEQNSFLFASVRGLVLLSRDGSEFLPRVLLLGPPHSWTRAWPRTHRSLGRWPPTRVGLARVCRGLPVLIEEGRRARLSYPCLSSRYVSRTRVFLRYLSVQRCVTAMFFFFHIDYSQSFLHEYCYM